MPFVLPKEHTALSVRRKCWDNVSGVTNAPFDLHSFACSYTVLQDLSCLRLLYCQVMGNTKVAVRNGAFRITRFNC